MSTLLSWLIAGIKFLVQIIVITWTTLAIYFSNMPWPALRLGLAVAFAAFAIWAFWLSHQRRMPIVAIALVLGVVAWWLTIAPSGDRNWRPDVAVMPRAFIEGDHVRITGVRNFDYPSSISAGVICLFIFFSISRFDFWGHSVKTRNRIKSP